MTASSPSMDWATRAIEAWRALRTACIRESEILEVLEGPGARRAPVWPMSQVIAAATGVGFVTGDLRDARALVRALAPYRRGEGYAPLPGHRRRYFDDNAWLGLDLVQLHLLTAEPDRLREARALWVFVGSGQDDDGGVRWAEGRRSRNACATGPSASLALRLHLLSADADLLARARRALRWLEATLRLPSGLIADHEDRGRLDETVWSYNQGAAAGAWALLHRATGEPAALETAHTLATASLAHFTDERLWVHPPVFNAIWFRNLLALDALAPLPGLPARLDGYLTRAWTHGRDPDTGLFTAGEIGSYDGTPTIDHAGLTQLLALRAWPTDRALDIA